MPRIPIVGRYRDNEDRSELSDAERNKRALVIIGAQIVGLFMFVVALLYVVVSVILGQGLIEPRSADDVLSSTKALPAYSWSSESVRLVKLGGDSQRQDVYRTAAIDLPANKWQATVIGVFNQPVAYSSDGKVTISLPESDQTGAIGWRISNDYCHKRPAVSAQSLAYPTPQEINKLHPKLISSDGTSFGDRAWILSFQPDAQFISQLFWLRGLDNVSQSDPAQRRWIMSKSERAALAAGKFKVDYAYAWVTRNPRWMRQVEVRFRFTNPGGSKYRFLAKLYPYKSGVNRPIKNLALTPKNRCSDSSQTIQGAPSTTATGGDKIPTFSDRTDAGDGLGGKVTTTEAPAPKPKTPTKPAAKKTTKTTPTKTPSGKVTKTTTTSKSSPGSATKSTTVQKTAPSTKTTSKK